MKEPPKKARNTNMQIALRRLGLLMLIGLQTLIPTYLYNTLLTVSRACGRGRSGTNHVEEREWE
jgi:hypothetical protein